MKRISLPVKIISCCRKALSNLPFLALSLLLVPLLFAQDPIQREGSQEHPLVVSTAEPPTLRVLVFYRAGGCHTCEIVKPQRLQSRAKAGGFLLEARYYDVSDQKNYELLMAVEKALADQGNEIPIIVVGKTVLGGEEEIERRLGDVFARYLSKGGSDWPQVETPDFVANFEKPMPKIYVAFFEEARCKECARVNLLMDYIEGKFWNVEVKRFDLSERANKLLCEAISEEVGVPEEKRMTPPTVFIGKDFLLGRDVTEENVIGLLKKYSSSGTWPLWDVKREDIQTAQERIFERFKAFGPLAILFAGLVDGVNPCAFATIVFFISYLALLGSGRKEMLIVGLAFAGAVFLTYLLIGLGTLSFVQRLSFYPALGKGLRVLTIGVTLGFAAISFYDFFQVWKGRLKEMKLQLPGFLKRRIRLTIAKEFRTRNFVIAALVTGFIVSLLEFACTGQVYLPTIVFVANSQDRPLTAVLFLVLYNLMFILPLIGILLLATLGMSVERLTSLMKSQVPLAKALLGVLFLALAGLLYVFM